MIYYDITEEDKKLIQIALVKLESNYDNNLVKVGIKDLLPFACL